MKKSNYTIAIFFFIFTLLFYRNSYTQVTQEWVARYNGFGNSTDQAKSIALDAIGNIYVTGRSRSGSSDYDYATIKYNSAGTEIWAAGYIGPGNSDDQATSVAVDNSGNVYVTGYSYGSGSYSDYATIKYNSAGVELWVARYNGPGNSYDESRSIALDLIGNVYVTGGSIVSDTSCDYTTIKYNQNGVQQWAARYNGPGNDYDFAYSIAADTSGNTYVTGVSQGNGNNDDYAVIKYNSEGVEQWVARYNGPGNSSDGSSSIVLDGTGNIYVTGSSTGIGTSFDFATIKYNPAGVQQWVARYNGSGTSSQHAYSLAVDNSGNVYVTGSSEGSMAGQYATVKYDQEGIQQWEKGYGGGDSYDYAASIAVDNSGNVYVTGSCYYNGASNDYATIKYNSSGDSVWVKRFNGSGNYDDEASSVVVDGSGNVYVTGSSTSIGTGRDYVTIKYSQLSDIKQIYSIIPKQFSLSQNYPNPFNPITHLEFGISDLGFVSLKVYDMLGKEIIILVNEKLSPGKYKYEFDGSGLPSGVYFYRLNAGEFTETKRMMLVK